MLVAEYLVWVRANGKAPSYVVKQEMHWRAHFLPRWTRLDQITTPAIEGYKVARAADGIRTTTLYKELVSLSRFLRWCRRQGHLAETPSFDRVRPMTDYAPPEYTDEQVQQLLAALPDRHTHHNRRAVRELYTLQWAQAMRPGEAQTIRWQDCDMEKRRITIRASDDKARVGKVIGMADASYAVLISLPGPHLPTARVFGPGTYRASLRKAAARLGLPHVTPHHFRHFRLSELASGTRDIAAVQFFAGHKNLSTTDRYVHSRTERTEEMLRQVDSVKRPRKALTQRRRADAAD